MQILCLEDNPTNVALVERIVGMTNHHLSVDSSAEHAYSAICSGKFDLILLDVELDGMDGLELVRQVRSEGVNVSIIALTAYAMAGDKERILAAGCTDYLSKPINVGEFLALLEKYAG